MLKEIRSLCSRGNIAIRKSIFAEDEVKCISYNTVVRRLLNIPPWESGFRMFVAVSVKSFSELFKVISYNCRDRVLKRQYSNKKYCSYWTNLLYVSAE